VSNAARVKHREQLIPLLQDILKQKPRSHWLAVLDEANVPCAPVATLPEVFSSEQVAARDMVLHCQHPVLGKVPLVAGGFKLDEQATALYRHPPLLGEHNDDLRSWLSEKSDE
jgi:crotonobetainyl-CoA:carnitine CoA-transferase CaiB-like acyl-CoA transferase